MRQLAMERPVFHEYEFSDREFVQLQRLVHAHCGISLSDEKKRNVYSRLARRLRELELDSFREYCDLIEAGHGQELEYFINALTTNLTSFFRELHHFDYLRDTVIPEVLQRDAASRRLRIWSAGCSTGEEAYSIAMTLLATIPDIDNWDVRVLASDLDTQVIETAVDGIYSDDKVAHLPEQFLKSYFHRGRGRQQGMVKVAPEVRDLVYFRHLNLMHDWPMQGPFDIIFCRNVVIYFDRDTQQRLFDRFADILLPRGHLLIGHSESLKNVSDRFQLIGRTIYRRIG